MVLFVLPAVAPEGAGLSDDPVANGLQGFFSIGSMALAVGAILLAGDAITKQVVGADVAQEVAGAGGCGEFDRATFGDGARDVGREGFHGLA